MLIFSGWYQNWGCELSDDDGGGGGECALGDDNVSVDVWQSGCTVR
jgi:hypothetical protein